MDGQNALGLPPSLSPDDLDSLSELSTVLAKVRAGIQSSSGITTDTTTSGSSATRNATAGTGIQGNGEQLSFKDVPGATDALKHKLQHARAQVRTLPDMTRSLDEQRCEMKELEERIKLQRALLESLREGGVRFGKDDGAGADVKMES
ncbi:putative microtubule-associated protein [Drechmeria coniospora]|uniref:Mediator of RNA polymerase II transcription subunit 9 n=1 Tax=Drechmeria coniospora TaxID=98403 RepID=A0A151GCT1_DRECN|nr:putative microtubule-associated protein [Drechmeria coniospora]KYK54854.1 putative microtubule-associated protein [Drechmeria coniospora]ODA75914.1 hypothetical protein RJ55_08555 [Drechmeria coniospora]